MKVIKASGSTSKLDKIEIGLGYKQSDSMFYTIAILF